MVRQLGRSVRRPGAPITPCQPVRRWSSAKSMFLSAQGEIVVCELSQPMRARRCSRPRGGVYRGELALRNAAACIAAMISNQDRPGASLCDHAGLDELRTSCSQQPMPLRRRVWNDRCLRCRALHVLQYPREGMPDQRFDRWMEFR